MENLTVKFEGKVFVRLDKDPDSPIGLVVVVGGQILDWHGPLPRHMAVQWYRLMCQRWN